MYCNWDENILKKCFQQYCFLEGQINCNKRQIGIILVRHWNVPSKLEMGYFASNDSTRNEFKQTYLLMSYRDPSDVRDNIIYGHPRIGPCDMLSVFPCIRFILNRCCAVNVPLPLTDTVQLPVNGPCKSRYLAINVNCTTVLSLNIQLYNCIAVFPRLHPNTTYMPNTDDTDYTDNRVVFIIWTDNVNAICTTTISSDIQLWYCIAVFPRLYPSNTYLPNTDYTDYTDNSVVFIIRTDNVNAPLTYHCR